MDTMDTSDTPPAARTWKPPFSPSQKKLIIGIVTALILVVLAGVAYKMYAPWKGAFLPSGELLITSESLPAVPAQILDLKTGEIRPVTLESAGTATIFDAVRADDTRYFLIGDTSRSNLYRETETGLEELTHSDSLKFDLSYDAASGIAAYVVAEGEETMVAAWNPSTGEEVDLGPGRNPALLSGGFFVLIERDGQIVSVHLETGDEYVLFNLAADAPFVLDAPRMLVMLYEPAISMLQTFSIATSVTGNYESAVPFAKSPRELLLTDQGVIGAAFDAEGNTLTLVNGSRFRNVTLTGELPADYQLSIYHD